MGIDRLEVGGCGHDEHALVADAPGEASGSRVLRGEPGHPRVERGDRVRDDPESGRTGGAAGIELRYRRVAGDPGALVFADGSPLAVVVVDRTPEGDRISGAFSVTNPDKPTGIRPPAPGIAREGVTARAWPAVPTG
ncbi:hypothetical protein [Streptomyces nojiriensis]|uniref:hypothetical protein n=1 Tax=Streptomyces nojiriensis TaxID=66374 RepID=UPI0035D608AE